VEEVQEDSSGGEFEDFCGESLGGQQRRECGTKGVREEHNGVARTTLSWRKCVVRTV
jgi:hypothetical protein